MKVPRSYLGKSVLRNKGELARLEAFIDLYRIARFEPGCVKWGKDGRVVRLERGELVVNFVYLGHRWKWERTRVGRFVRQLCKEGMAVARKVDGLLILKILDEASVCATDVKVSTATKCGVDAQVNAHQNAHSKGMKNKALEEVDAQQNAQWNAHYNKKVIQEESRRENPHTPRAGEGRAETEAFRPMPSAVCTTAEVETAARALPATNPMPANATAGTAAAEPLGADANPRCADAAYAAELRSSTQALEQMAMGQGMTVAEVRDKLAAFEMEMEATAQRHSGRTDYRRHFYNWLRLGREIGRRNALAEQRLRQRHMTKEESNREVMQSCLDDISARIAAAEHDEEARRFRREVLGRRE